MKQSLLVLIICCLVIQLQAQDRHFSQFYASPLTLNPALTGMSDGKYRAAISHRNQWQSILDEPFVTTGAAFDGKFSPYKNRRIPDAFGVGVSFFSDKISSSDFTNNQIMLSFAYHKALDMRGTQFLSAGYQLGIGQRSINLQSVTFGDQFDGVNGYVLPTGENFPTNNIAHADMAAGVFWTYAPKANRNVYVGASLSHFNQPNISFFRDLDEPIVNRLLMKYALHAGYRAALNTRTSIEPRALFLMQGQQIELNVGANVKTLISDYLNGYLHLGGWVRPVSDTENGMTVDAIVLMTAFQVSSFQVGLSYDINVSSLASATNARGGLELSFIFIGDYENDSVICPTF